MPLSAASQSFETLLLDILMTAASCRVYLILEHLSTLVVSIIEGCPLASELGSVVPGTCLLSTTRFRSLFGTSLGLLVFLTLGLVVFVLS